MKLHKVILHPGIRTSGRFARLNWFQRDLFYGLLNAVELDGRFEANPGLLRAALYALNLNKVSEGDVRLGLQKLHEEGMIKLWTALDGRGYGEVLRYRQNFKFATSRIPGPDEQPELFTGARGGAADDPPPRPKKNRIEGKCVKKPPYTHDTISQEEWLASLQAQWPGVNFAVEMQAAQAYVRKQRGPAAKLTRKFFEKHWLAGLEGDVDVNAVRKAQRSEVTEIDAPENWRELVEGTNYGPGGAFEVQSWAQVPGDVRAHLLRQMAEDRSDRVDLTDRTELTGGTDGRK